MINWSVTDEADEADAVIVNTCGFIEPAKEESVNTILEAAELKEKNPDMKLIVAGCLTQRYKKKLVEGLPEVDVFVGTDEFPKIGNILNGYNDEEKGKIYAKRTHYLYDGELPKKIHFQLRLPTLKWQKVVSTTVRFVSFLPSR